MPEWLRVLLAVLGGLAIVWIALVIFLAIQQRRSGKLEWREIVRLAPDVVRLVKRLVFDRAVPLATRVWLGALLVYLLSPIDLIPDFIPVLGYADDAIIVATALRYAMKHAGIAAIERNWPGTVTGLQTTLRLVGLAR
jgi:uncharacterized membrane protein YkvA (DUF1232 family)